MTEQGEKSGKRTKQERALNLFLTGMPIRQIARAVVVHYTTIYRWMEEHNWLEERDKRIKALEDKREVDFEKMAKEQIGWSRIIYMKYFADIKAQLEKNPDDVKIKSEEAVAFLKLAQSWNPKFIPIGNRGHDVLNPDDIVKVFQDDDDTTDIQAVRTKPAKDSSETEESKRAD